MTLSDIGSYNREAKAHRLKATLSLRKCEQRLARLWMHTYTTRSERKKTARAAEVKDTKGPRKERKKKGRKKW